MSEARKQPGLAKDPFETTPANPLGSLVRAESPASVPPTAPAGTPTTPVPGELKKGHRTKPESVRLYSIYLSEEERDAYQMLLTRLRVKHHVRLTFSEFVRLALRGAKKRLETLNQQGKGFTLEDVEREIQ